MPQIELLNIDNIKLLANLSEKDQIQTIQFEDLSLEIKNQLNELQKAIKKTSHTLESFITPSAKSIIISREEYLHLITIKNSVISHRSIDDSTYLKYLFQLLSKPQLEKYCRENVLKGFSNKNKKELIEHIINQLTDDEKRQYIIDNEYELLSLELAKSLRIISGKDNKESIISIKIINEKEQELELSCEGLDWISKTSLTINPSNLRNPERDCDCKFGESGGFCAHFWILFIKALKLKYLTLEDWKLTQIPESLKKNFQEIDL